MEALEPLATGRIANSNPHLGHIGALDGLRGIAVLMVMVFHFSLGYQWHGRMGMLYARVIGAGWSGVDLFFVLSGFLITGILYDSKNGEHYFLNFYARRALRIFPLYYGVLFVVLIALPSFGLFRSDAFRELVHRQGWLWLYGSNILMSVENSFSVLDTPHFLFNGFWSLAVEEHFYFLWPLVILRFERRVLMGICVGLLIAAFAFRTVLVNNGFWVAAYQLTPCRMDSLAAGAFIAVAMRSQRGNKALVTWGPKVLSAAGISLILLFVYRRGFMLSDRVIQMVGHTLLAIFFATLISVVVLRSKRMLVLTLQSRALREVGMVSYGLYVFHTVFEPELNSIAPIAWLAQNKIFEVPAALVHTAIAFMVSFGAAWLSFRYFENPINRFKSHFYDKNPVSRR